MMVFSLLFFLFILMTPLDGAAATPQPGGPLSAPPMQLHDIKDVIVLPAPVPWWYWAGGILVLLLVLVVVFLLVKRRGKKEENVLSAAEQALAELAAARALMRPDQARAFAIKVADILRTYIEQQFHLFRPNLTTREFLGALTGQADMENSTLAAWNELLRDWLNHCDMVKFARYNLTKEEMEQMLAQVRQFVEATGKEDVPPNGGQKNGGQE